MLEMDVPMPAGSGERGRTAGAPLVTWVEQRRPFVIAGAFVLAVVLGIVIGLATASSSPSDDPGGNVDVTAPERRPPLPAISWDGSREPGKGMNLQLGQDLSPIVRTALTWAAADYALAKAGKPTWSKVYLDAGSPTPGTANAQTATSRATLTDQSITIPQGLLYGAVQGADAAHDQFWAVGNADTTGSTIPTDVPVDNLYVWERIGSGPWTVVASGANACAKISPGMTAIWGTHPAPCGAS
ncbi:hypothetical protein BCD48_09735 [Pseudofrankia sp. BMG5.36]|nr:hypothetical protein BCD48_09735 [Pseudofrankia sp. BMG5.36]